MKLTRQQKIMTGVMVVALSALAFDRFVLGTDLAGPAETQASADGTEAPVEEILGNIRSLESKGSRQNNFVANALNEIAKQHPVNLASIRDAFEPSTQWLHSAAGQTNDRNTIRLSAEQFRKTHALSGLIAVENTSYAVIDENRVLRIGDQLDGFTMVALDKRTAVFESHGTRIVLTLETDT